MRDYGVTKVFVTAPNLTEIRSSTQYDISSDGILNYDSLKLISQNYDYPESFPNGDFLLFIDTQNIQIVSNNISTYYISGSTENMSVSFPSGNGRFDGSLMIAKKVHIFHRGSNDIIVHPIELLSGELRGTGDLITVNEPISTDVQQYYTGQLISN